MNTQLLLVLSGVLQTLATVARNPALSGGAGGANANTYADLLELASRLVVRGNEALDDLEELKAEVDEMVASGAKPDQSKIDEWKARSDKAHDELQAMKDRPEPVPILDDFEEVDDNDLDDDERDEGTKKPLG
jgi:hypothetical protein